MVERVVEGEHLAGLPVMDLVHDPDRGIGRRDDRQVDSRVAGPRGNLEIFLWLAAPSADAEAGEGGAR